jgi:hypothetical protein
LNSKRSYWPQLIFYHKKPNCSRLVRAERLFDNYCDVYARGASALRPRVLRLYKAHRQIALALRVSQQLGPYGDEAARASLLEAQRLTR